MKLIALGLGLLLLAWVTNSFAVFDLPEGTYIEGGIGAGYLKDGKLSNTSIDSTNTLLYQQKNASNVLYNLAIGQLFSFGPDSFQALGLELAFRYFDKEHSSVNNQFIPNGSTQTVAVNTSQDSSLEAMSLDVVYQTRLGVLVPNFSFLAKLGFGYGRLKTNIYNTVSLANQINAPASITTRNNGAGLDWGVGFQYSFNNLIALRTEILGLLANNDVRYTAGIVNLVVYV